MSHGELSPATIIEGGRDTTAFDYALDAGAGELVAAHEVVVDEASIGIVAEVVAVTSPFVGVAEFGNLTQGEIDAVMGKFDSSRAGHNIRAQHVLKERMATALANDKPELWDAARDSLWNLRHELDGTEPGSEPRPQKRG